MPHLKVLQITQKHILIHNFKMAEGQLLFPVKNKNSKCAKKEIGIIGLQWCT